MTQPSLSKYNTYISRHSIYKISLPVTSMHVSKYLHLHLPTYVCIYLSMYQSDYFERWIMFDDWALRVSTSLEYWRVNYQQQEGEITWRQTSAAGSCCCWLNSSTITTSTTAAGASTTTSLGSFPNVSFLQHLPIGWHRNLKFWRQSIGKNIAKSK